MENKSVDDSHDADVDVDADQSDSDQSDDDQSVGEPIEEDPPPTPPDTYLSMDDLSGMPKAYEKCDTFFTLLNQTIRGANQEHNVLSIDDGTIPAQSYSAFCSSYIAMMRKAKEEKDTDAGWRAFHTTYDILKAFNERHHLPKKWNIDRHKAHEKIGTDDPRGDEMYDSAPEDDNENEPQAEVEPEAESKIDDSDERLFSRSVHTELDNIDARAVKKRPLNFGEVIYWWRVGTGTQVLVQHGDDSCPIFRIRAGSYQLYDKRVTEQVLSSQSRGNAKFIATAEDGTKTEAWRYRKSDVRSILGIGFKIEDDKEYGINSKLAIKPGYGGESYHRHV
ncbi:uncharacterized protein N7483_007931 [Penicillium malachiteum]|uniref:uncharacterized protein n=1 Tax=Penicillium malachiteum TaxID=1324776 RepID=UPI0025482D55|nr:uncharacterized protein N7483_007931 [Penicillium malachiteum]KAJ5726574.1 hypothetical protein N7483_007931 [Penicillium malachiteum]